jgi:hypothetical protein
VQFELWDIATVGCVDGQEGAGLINVSAAA